MPPIKSSKPKRQRKTRTRKQLTPRKPTTRKRSKPPAPSQPPALSLRLLFSPPLSSISSSLPQENLQPLSLAASDATESSLPKTAPTKTTAKRKQKEVNSAKPDEDDVFLPRRRSQPRKTHTNAAVASTTHPVKSGKRSRRAKDPTPPCPKTKLEKPQRCFKCRLMGLPENALCCTKCQLVWHSECLEVPLTFRPASWTCPLHISAQKIQTHSLPFRLLPSCGAVEQPIVNQSGGFAGLLNLLKERASKSPAAPSLPGIKVPDAVIAHYNNALYSKK